MMSAKAETQLHGSCDCGEVTVTLARAPDTINACPCDYCRRVGANWGYLEGSEVRIEGATVAYGRAARTLEFRRCELRGVVTHWQRHGRPDGETMGVNMSNFDAEALDGIPVVATEEF